MDGPQLDKPLYATLFLSKDGARAALHWNRHKAKAEVTKAQPSSLKKAA